MYTNFFDCSSSLSTESAQSQHTYSHAYHEAVHSVHPNTPTAMPTTKPYTVITTMSVTRQKYSRRVSDLLDASRLFFSKSTPRCSMITLAITRG